MAGPVGDFSVIARVDGVSQWAYKGELLYAYTQDGKAGDTKGDGVEKAWHATVLEPVPPRPAWVKVVASDGGDLLADASGMTIYAYDEDRNKLVYARGEDCFGECIASSWTPVPAAEQTAPIGNWSVIKTGDGRLQWAFQGRPLYTSKEENRPGDLSGIMLRRSRAWRPLMLTLPSIQGASPNG
jgi:predicted lipoprotein with Yx(FWY)xxD motif